MNIDIVKDDEGNEHFIFDSSELYDDSIMGNSSSDFEVLQILGKGSFGVVMKVRSIHNGKVYAMKRINFKEITDEKERKFCKNEITFLEGLSHPHINKYYKNFYENDNLYTITELENNGDLGSFQRAHQSLDKHINEEVLWNIFLQSMSALTYIHKNGIIHRDIKPGNIFITNDEVIKIGDFGVSTLVYKQGEGYLQQIATVFQNRGSLFMPETVGTPVYMAPEIYTRGNNNIGQKADVYSMGVTFFEMCYYHPPRAPTPSVGPDGYPIYKFYPIIKEEDKNVKYSKELLNIIDLMIKENERERPDSFQVYEMMKKEYNKRYVKNSGINAVLRCMYSLEDFTCAFLRMQNSINSTKTPIGFAYLRSISILRNRNGDWIDAVNNFRQILAERNSKLEGSKEVNPQYILAFLMEKLHKEFNNVQRVNQANERKHIIEIDDEDKTNKDEMRFKFANNFKKKFNSVISNLFLGLMKTKKICNVCKMGSYSFNAFCIVTFEMEKIMEFARTPNILNIIDGFRYQKNHYSVNTLYCQKCIDKTPHNVFKQIYSMPYLLIISIDRKNPNLSKIPVNFPENLVVPEVEYNHSPFKYYLTGVIIRSYGNEHYICYCQNFNDKQWYFCDENLTTKINSMSINQNGEVVMLFYVAYRENK